MRDVGHHTGDVVRRTTFDSRLHQCGDSTGRSPRLNIPDLGVGHHPDSPSLHSRMRSPAWTSRILRSGSTVLTPSIARISRLRRGWCACSSVIWLASTSVCT